MRHGRTAYNDAQRYQGLRDIPLSQMGGGLRPAEGHRRPSTSRR
ncbi:MAG: histidine phosphatase family protein [Dysosmobacter welbionis]